MSASPPSVSVVIPTRRPDYIDAILAILLSDAATTEVVLLVGPDVERGHVDRWSAREPRVHIVEASDQVGESFVETELPRDLAVNRCRGEVLLMLDDDVLPGGGLVSAHAVEHTNGFGRVILGYMPVRLPAGRRFAASARVYSESYERACKKYAAEPASILLSLWGGNYSVRRSDWIAASKLPRVDTGYRGEDRELGLRFRTLGLSASFEPRLRATHFYERKLDRLIQDATASGIAYQRLLEAYPYLNDDPAAPRPGPGLAMRVLGWVAGGRFGAGIALRGLAASARMMDAAGVQPVARRLVRACWQLAFDLGARLARGDARE